MKKKLILLLFGFIVFGIMLNYAHFVIADEENNNNAHTENASESNNGNSINNSNNSNNSKDNENGDNDTEYNFEDEDGGEVNLIVHHNNTNEGNLNVEEDNFEDENGNNISIINRNEINGNNNNGEFNNGEFNNGEFKVNGVNAETEVELQEDFENNKTEIKAILGSKNQSIEVMPDEASQTALKALTDKGFRLKLIAIGEGNEIKAVYSAELDQEGRILGLFPVTISSNAIIDSQTGDVTELNQPWYKFLVFGEHSSA